MATEGGELHRRLRTARISSGLTQSELASIAGVAVNTVKQYESGRIKPGADALAGYARAGIELRYLLLGEGSPMRAVYPETTAAVALQIGEGVAAWHGEVAITRVVETMLAIVASLDSSCAAAGLALTPPKRVQVVQALFEEALESGELPRAATVLRFVKAASGGG